MEESIDSFIARRRQELADAERPLREQLAAIERERHKLDRAEAAIASEAHVSDISKEGDMSHFSRRAKGGSLKTMKECVIEILGENASGLSAIEILPLLNRRLGTDYERTSLSPQLSRLKSEGVVILDGINWRLARNDAEITRNQFVEGGLMPRLMRTAEDANDLLGSIKGRESEEN